MRTRRKANLKIERSTIGNDAKRPRGRPPEFDRDQALSQAMEVFWRLGYEATSMSDLRAHLGLTQASLYAAFGSKEKLFREAVDLYRRTAGATTLRALQEERTARESIQAVLVGAAESFTRAGVPAGCLVVLGTMNCTPASKGVQDHLHALRLETPKAIYERLVRGRNDGDVPASAPINSLVEYYTTVLHGLSIQARDGVGRNGLLAVVDCAMATWDHLIEERISFVQRPQHRPAGLE